MPVATLSPELAQRTVTLMAPSKTYNVPGLKCAWAIVPAADLRAKLTKARRGITGGGNIFGYASATAAFTQGGAWLEALREYLRGNRDIVERFVATTPGLTMTHVEATYLAWIDVRGLGLAAAARFFERAGVGLADGKDFGSPGYLRMTFATPRATLHEALARACTGLAATELATTASPEIPLVDNRQEHHTRLELGTAPAKETTC